MAKLGVARFKTAAKVASTVRLCQRGQDNNTYLSILDSGLGEARKDWHGVLMFGVPRRSVIFVGIA